MKAKIAIILILVAVFVLGSFVAAVYKRTGDAPDGENHTASATVSDRDTEPEYEETVLNPEDSGESAKEEQTGTEEEAAGEATDTVQETKEETRTTLPQFDELLRINPYVAGWLKIDDSVIDVPVVYTPGSQNYFLHRDIAGNADSTGTLFIAIDWEEGYNNTLVYGHNMKDGRGFGSLQNFAKASYAKSHPVIHFDTLYEERDYELYAAFYSQIDEEELETEEDREEKDKAIEEEGIARKEQELEEAGEENVTVEPEELTLADLDLHRDFGGIDIYRQEKDEDNGRFRYYYYTDLSDRADFDYYASNVKARSLYDTGVNAQWGDEFITLSTCSYQVRNGRFVVVGVRKKSE